LLFAKAQANFPDPNCKGSKFEKPCVRLEGEFWQHRSFPHKTKTRCSKKRHTEDSNSLRWHVRNLPRLNGDSWLMARRWLVLISSWRVTILFCDSQSWSDAELSSELLTFSILRYLSFHYLFCSDVLKFNSLKPSVKRLNRSASVTWHKQVAAADCWRQIRTSQFVSYNCLIFRISSVHMGSKVTFRVKPLWREASIQYPQKI